MHNPKGLKINISHAVAVSIFVLTLMLQFNNCGKISSQMAEQSSNASASNVNSAPNTPVDPNNPYVLNCLSSSDGVKVSMDLTKSVLQSTNGINKINSLDWDQSVDLVVTLDNECVLRTDFSDPIMSYLDHDQLKTEFAKSIYVIKKESVRNLDLFIKNALDSECLISANKNHSISINADGPDTYFNSLVHLMPTSTNAVAINAPKTVLDSILTFVNDPSYAANPKLVKVAVLDTGIDSTNPDLSPVLARDAGNNIVGKNSTSAPGSGFLADSGFHGTHVSGLIGAQYNNSLGISGVYGRNLSLYPIRASNNGSDMDLASIVDGIQFAIASKVDVLNMSLGTTGDYTEFRDAVNDALAAGITVVVAAGNNGKVLGSTVNTYPAMYSTSSNGVITVGSLDLTSQTISNFSNRSATYVDILAPGSNGTVGIFSTLPLSVNIATGQSVGPGYGSAIQNPDGSIINLINGTSMAAPIVSGAVATLISMAKSRNKILPATKIKEWIRGSGSSKSTTFASYAVNGSYLNLDLLTTYAKSQIPNLTSGTGGTPNPNPTPTNPTIATQPKNRQAVIGEKIDLSVVISGASTGIAYQWYRNNVAITNETSATLTINNIQQNNAGIYRVRATIGTSVLVSNDAQVKVGLDYCH